MGQSRPLFNLFSSFQTNKHSNSQPSDYESHPLTIRPGLPPRLLILITTFLPLSDTIDILLPYGFLALLCDGGAQCDQIGQFFGLWATF